MTGASISAVVMTLNEEHNIDYCLRSVRTWCDEVIVVDMLSDDRTPEIAGRYADLLLTHERVGFVEPARVKGFAAARGDWVINIDADEVVPPALAEWIRQFVDGDPPYDVVRIPRANVFLGRWIRSSPWWPGKPRLFRRGMMETSSEIHHGFRPRPGARVHDAPPDPDRSLWHFAHPSLHGLIEKTNRYTTIEAQQAIARGMGDPRPQDLLTGPIRALGAYVLRRGYRDGMAGLTYAVDRAYYGFLGAAKRWDEARAGRRQAQYDRMRERIVSGYADRGRERLGDRALPDRAPATDSVPVGRDMEGGAQP
ncbi:MAG: glycosyltransferase family 2 protein [Chloroflexota bacterium]